MRIPRRKSPGRILLVEDHTSTLEVLAAALRHQGYRVTPVGSMRAALDAIHDTVQDLIVCDIGLPDGDGWQFMTAIRARFSTPAIAMSAFSAPADLERSCAAGFASHLVKPFDPSELYEAILKLLPPSAPPASKNRPSKERAPAKAKASR